MVPVDDTPEILAVPLVEKVDLVPQAPEPAVTGNDKIEVLKHELALNILLQEYPSRTGVDVAIRNVSNSTIATAIFQAVFYNQVGNVVESTKHYEIALDPETSRAIHIPYSPNLHGIVTSYDIRLVRTTTADVEKVQLRRHENRTTETGEEEIKGYVKNISMAKTNAAVIATFYDMEDTELGTKVAVVRDIEPNSLREYELYFKPQEGDIVHRYTLKVGELMG